MTEGTVVGIFGENISLQTDSADMVGGVSARAAIVGSMPMNDQTPRGAGAVVAYVGKVPVRAIGPVAIGDALVPSGRNDGSAVAGRSAQEGRVLGWWGGFGTVGSTSPSCLDKLCTRTVLASMHDIINRSEWAKKTSCA